MHRRALGVIVVVVLLVFPVLPAVAEAIATNPIELLLYALRGLALVVTGYLIGRMR